MCQMLYGQYSDEIIDSSNRIISKSGLTQGVPTSEVAYATIKNAVIVKTCKDCKEINPENFGICWNCNK